MTTAGHTECLKAKTGTLVPGFQNRVGRAVIHQIDHLFVSTALTGNLLECEVGSKERVFGADNLSDHLPIIAVFAHPEAS